MRSLDDILQVQTWKLLFSRINNLVEKFTDTRSYTDTDILTFMSNHTDIIPISIPISAFFIPIPIPISGFHFIPIPIPIPILGFLSYRYRYRYRYQNSYRYRYQIPIFSSGIGIWYWWNTSFPRRRRACFLVMAPLRSYYPLN